MRGRAPSGINTGRVAPNVPVGRELWISVDIAEAEKATFDVAELGNGIALNLGIGRCRILPQNAVDQASGHRIDRQGTTGEISMVLHEGRIHEQHGPKPIREQSTASRIWMGRSSQS